jgi:ubiquinone/menaquinone biosynthesis C-methylase UbiE
MKHDHVEGHGDLIRWAFSYDLLMKVVTLGREQDFRRAILDAAKVARGNRVLDIGCGTGTLALAAKERVGPEAQVNGIDPSDEMVARARAKAARKGLAVTFDIASAQKLPFSDGSFDVVLSSLMLHHLPDPVRKDAVSEVCRVLKPKGRFLVVELIQKPGLFSSLMPARLTHSHNHSHAFEDAKRLMKDGGFREVDSGAFKWRFAAWVLGEAGQNHT